MADHPTEGGGEKKSVVSKILPTKNFFKRMARRFGMPFRDSPTEGFDVTEFPTYKELDSLIGYNTVKTLNELVVRTERRWEGSPGEHIENVNELRESLLKLYTYSKGTGKDEGGEDEGEINDSIGPYTDESILDLEGDYAAKGTPRVKEFLAIFRDGRKIDAEFSIPKIMPIVYDDMRGRDDSGNPSPIAYNVAFFGSEKPAEWLSIYKKEVSKICEDVEQAALQGETDPARINNIKENIGVIKDIYGKVISNTLNKISIKIENVHRGNLIGGGGVKQFYNVLKTKHSEIMSFRLTDEDMYFTHTFRIIKPVIYNKDGTIKNQLTGFKLPDEIGEGLDEHGWPLEVGDGETKFNGEVLGKGIVIIDIYKRKLLERDIQVLREDLTKLAGKTDADSIHARNVKQQHLNFKIARLSKVPATPRRVPNEFITELDPLLTFTYIYVQYDSFRDDIRDARYHKNAITVMERIMTELKGHNFLKTMGSIVEDHPQTMEDIEAGNHAAPKVKFNKLAAGDTKRIHGIPDPATVSMGIKPTNLLPAFDLRAKSKTRHMGRIYYYETQNESVQSLEPTISTRGAAMYILHRVIEQVKYWGGTGDPSKAGVLEVLEKIGERTNGFDIGPNMGTAPTYPGWGKNLTKNPFNPKRG